MVVSDKKDCIFAKQPVPLTGILDNNGLQDRGTGTRLNTFLNTP